MGTLHEYFRWQIPVGSSTYKDNVRHAVDMPASTACVTLRGQIHSVIGIERIFVHLLRETEVSDFDLATVVSSPEKNVAWLEIVVNLERHEDMAKVPLRAVRW